MQRWFAEVWSTVFDIGIAIPDLSDKKTDIFRCLIFFVEILAQWGPLFVNEKYEIMQKYDKIRVMINTAQKMLKTQMQSIAAAKIPIKMIAYLKEFIEMFFFCFVLFCFATG